MVILLLGKYNRSPDCELKAFSINVPCVKGQIEELGTSERLAL